MKHTRDILKAAERHPDVALRRTVDGHILLLVEKLGVVAKLNPRKNEKGHGARNIEAQLRRAGIRL